MWVKFLIYLDEKHLDRDAVICQDTVGVNICSGIENGRPGNGRTEERGEDEGVGDSRGST